METPGFIMNDEFMEVFKSCETHRQRSILLQMTISFLETGLEPEIPKGLQDKWRFIHSSLVNSRAELNQNETTAKSDSIQVETETKSDSIQVETKTKSTSNTLSTIDRLSSIDNLSSITITSNEVIDSNDRDSDSNDSDSGSYFDDFDGPIPCYPSCEEMDEAWKEFVESQNQEFPNDGKVSCDVESEDEDEPQEPNLTKDDAPVGTPANSNEELLDLTGNRVLQRIWEKYRQNGRPVPYTRKEAEKELQIEAEQFYGATKYLVSIGALSCKKVVLSDGHSIYSYTPFAKSTQIARRQVVFPEINLKHSPDMRYGHVLKYYMEQPFNYDKSWSVDDLTENNLTSLNMLAKDLEKQQINGTPESYGNMLYKLINSLKNNCNLEPTPAHKN